MASVSGTFFGLGLAHPPQSITQAIQDGVHRAFRGHIGPLGVGRELLVHCFSGDACIGQWRLKLGVGLTCRLYERVDLIDQVGMLFFGLVTPACGKALHAANTRAEFVQAGVDGSTPPAEKSLGVSRTPRAILDRHLGLELPPAKTGQLARRQLDGVQQFWQHSLIPETKNARILPKPPTTSEQPGVDHLQLAALRLFSGQAGQP